jgi:hypothetical protein
VPDLNDPDTFRSWATKVHRASLVGLVLLALACTAFGHYAAGFWGLVIGAVIGIVIAFGGIFAVTLLWALSQDGA